MLIREQMNESKYLNRKIGSTKKVLIADILKMSGEKKLSHIIVKDIIDICI
ncbi:hypothetical protein JMUB7507_26420 [Staphylococcus aureus]